LISHAYVKLNTEAPRTDIMLYLFSQAMGLHCACYMFMKEAMEVKELRIVRHFVEYFHENAATL
jgi:hypothetical protein